MGDRTGPRTGCHANVAMCYLVEQGGSATIAALRTLLKMDGLPPRALRGVIHILENYGYITQAGPSVRATDAGKLYVARHSAPAPVAIIEKYVGIVAGIREIPAMRPLNVAKHFAAPPFRDGALDFRDIPSLMGGKRIKPSGGAVD
jgi:hypothetical protein